MKDDVTFQNIKIGSAIRSMANDSANINNSNKYFNSIVSCKICFLGNLVSNNQIHYFKIISVKES